MRTIGIITNLNPITIKVYDIDTSKVIDITPTHYDETFDYQILSPVEYHKDTNSINIILPDTILTEQEKNYLMKAFTEVMSIRENAKIFLEIISEAFSPEPRQPLHK